MSGKIYTKNFGCKVNAAELLETGEALASRGRDVTEIQSTAELPAGAGATLIVNSCTVTATADAKLRVFVRRARKENPGLRIVVGGCYVRAPHFSPDTLPGAEYRVRVAEILDSLSPNGDGEGNGRHPYAKKDSGAVRTRAFIRLQDGCNSKCSFCIIPLVRPAESLARDDVLKRVDAALASGVKEIVLTGTNIGKYHDGAGDFVGFTYEALEMARAAGARIRLSSVEPEDARPHVMDMFEHPAICPHLHLPLQSGSARVLALMRRRYSIDRYRDTVEVFRSRFPRASITTDIIVGFPGETEEDFGQTLAAVEFAGFERIHAFRYSPRPGTVSEGMAAVTEREVKARTGRLLKLSDKITRGRIRRHVGRTVEVLIEEITGGCCRGYSGEYLRVNFLAAGECINRLAEVRVTGVGDDGLLTGILDREV